MELRIEVLEEDLTEAKYYWEEDNKITTWHFTKKAPYNWGDNDKKSMMFFRVDNGDWQVITGTSTFLLLHKSFTQCNFDIPVNERGEPVEECPATPLLNQHLLLTTILFNNIDHGIVTPIRSVLEKLEDVEDDEVWRILDKPVYGMERRIDRLFAR